MGLAKCHCYGHTTLVKAVLTSQVIYHAAPLIIPPPIIKSINKIERAFLWAGTEKITGAKCKVNWATVYRPKHLGGFGVLDLDKFARALRLRWLWYEWKETDKLWVGMGNPCDKVDINLFYASTIISIGNGVIALFFKIFLGSLAKNRRTLPTSFTWPPHEKLES